MWVTCVELIPSSKSLPVDDVFCACVVLDLTIRCFFSVKFVPVFNSGMLVPYELNWLKFLVFLSCIDVN